MKKILLFSVLLSFSAVNAQIEITPKETTKEKVEHVQKPANESNTEVYFVTNWSRTNRLLTENKGVFGDTLGIRSDESYLDKWSFGIGIKNDINNFLQWEGGISFIRNGESYLYEGADTSFQYATTYNYIGMPLKLSVYRGDNFQFFASAGIVPQMFLRYRQDQNWTTSNGTKGDTLIKSTSGYNSFVLGTVFNVGAKMSLGKNWSLLVSPEYRMNLTSTYNKQDSYIHKGRAFGITFGLTLKI
jgi:long-subunit fatty acid transport protein